MPACRRAVHGIYISDDPAAVGVGMIPVPFLGDIDRTALSRPAALTGIVSGAVSASILIHLRRRDRADLRIEINTAGIQVVALSVLRDIDPVLLAASAFCGTAAPLCPPDPGMAAVPYLHREIGKCQDPYERSHSAAHDDLDAVVPGHDLRSGKRQAGAASHHTGMPKEGFSQIGSHFVPYISLGEAYVVRHAGLSTFCENRLNEKDIRYYHLIRHIRYECGSNGHLNWQDTPTA